MYQEMGDDNRDPYHEHIHQRQFIFQPTPRNLTAGQARKEF